MIMSENITKIAPALLKAQSAMENASKGAKNPFYKSKYADLNSVREASHGPLNSNGVAVLQPLIQKDGKTFVRTLLLHESGEYFGSDTEVVVAKQNDPQAYGSAISYARRYGLQALVSLGAEDDDGEKAMSRDKSTRTTEVIVTKAQEIDLVKPEVGLVKPEIIKSSFKRAVIPDITQEITPLDVALAQHGPERTEPTYTSSEWEN